MTMKQLSILLIVELMNKWPITLKTIVCPISEKPFNNFVAKQACPALKAHGGVALDYGGQFQYIASIKPNVGHVDKKVKIMATKKTKKQLNSLRQEKSEINRKLKECQEEMKKLRETMKQLNGQKQEIIKKIRKLNDRPIVWDDNTPLIELVIIWRMARFKKMLSKWQNYSHEMINPNEVTHFNFDLQYQSEIIADLKSSMINNDHLFYM